MSEPETVAESPTRTGLLGTLVGRPVTATVGAILVMLFGGLSVADLPIQLTPDVSRPVLNVRTTWPGASPTEVEAEILEPQEDALKSLPGLVRMTSEARPDSGSLSLELEVGTDLDEALVRASNRLGQVADYPDAVREPTIETSDSTGPPVVVIAIRSIEGRDVDPYLTWVQDAILPEIQRVPGVGEIRLRGGRETVFDVQLDPTELAARGIRITDAAARLRAELRDVSGGDLDVGRRRFLVRTMAVGATPEDLERVVLGVGPDGTPIRVADVGRATVSLRRATGVAYANDKPALIMLVDRESGSNVLALTEQIRARVEELDAERFAPEGLRFEVISDQVDYIQGSLVTVRNNLLLGGLLAMLALLAFLRAFAPSLLVGLTIPICALGTVLGMVLLGRSVNVVSLAGITFAVGMVLDNGIVVLEAIDVARSKVASSAAAALFGVTEVWGAIVASTATTAAVFLPVIAWDGEVGQLLRDVAIAISLAIGFSLLASVLVIPALASKLPPKRGGNDARWLTRFTSAVGGIVAVVVRRRALGALLVAGAAAGSILLTFEILPPLEYLPAGNRNLVFGTLVPPPGTSVAETQRVARGVQAQLGPHTGQEIDGVPAIGRSFFVGGPDRIFGGATAEDPTRLKDLEAYLRGVQSSVPGFFAFTSQASLFGRRGGSRSIELDLSGGDLNELVRVAGQVMRALGEVLPDAQIRPDPSLDAGALELRARPRREESATLAPSTPDIGLMLDALVDGAIVGELGREGEAQLDVVLRVQHEGVRDDADRVASAPVVSATGEVVPFGTLAELSEELGPTVLKRIERRRAITLQIGPPDDVPLEEALARVRRVVQEKREDGTIPMGVDTGISGSAGDLEVAKVRFAQVLLFALIISYLLMAALFESFLAPLVILITLPLGAAGGMGALRLVDLYLAPQPLDLMTALGFLILIGTVVNNAILVVDGSLSGLRQGRTLDAAVREAVESRVRPILMTTATSVAGLMPMVLAPGEGSELYRGVGAIVLGGLTFSTILTVFVVPAFFALVWRLFRRVPASG
ncbi:MAG: efflux RND transporter permease subunit [Sandaracinus sp.]|nr:efflux RND transporter permease subunit [Sandaracinus sp.]MCB9622036.1 efflux RND transporter permease subunit [Sandaracinus sp.]